MAEMEALYGIEFVSNEDLAGGGVVVLETGRVFGGDSYYIYVGSYEVKNDKIHVKVKCTNDKRFGVLSGESIFGDIDEFNLFLEGDLEDHQSQILTLKGHMIEDPSKKISVKLTRRAELP